MTQPLQSTFKYCNRNVFSQFVHSASELGLYQLQFYLSAFYVHIFYIVILSVFMQYMQMKRITGILLEIVSAGRY